jgi:hypothetical protein
MTQKERIEMRELEVIAEGRFYKNSGGLKWNYYGDVIECMTAAEEKKYFKLCNIRDKASSIMAGD